MGVSTVESHLSHVYRKLGVRRAELAGQPGEAAQMSRRRSSDARRSSAAVEAFLDGVEQGPCALVLSGEPGIGKTVLWEGGLEEARAALPRV